LKSAKAVEKAESCIGKCEVGVFAPNDALPSAPLPLCPSVPYTRQLCDWQRQDHDSGSRIEWWWIDETAHIMASLQAASVDTTVLIAVVVGDVARDFLSLAEVLTTSEIFAAQVSPTAIQDEFARFKVPSAIMMQTSSADSIPRSGPVTSQHTGEGEDRLRYGFLSLIELVKKPLIWYMFVVVQVLDDCDYLHDLPDGVDSETRRISKARFTAFYRHSQWH
jgi:hypothetical protein